MNHIKKSRLIIRVAGLVTVLMLSACARYEWVQTSTNNQPFDEADMRCQAQARKNVRYNTPVGQTYGGGAIDQPSNPPVVQERYEVDRCLNAQGFEKVKAK